MAACETQNGAVPSNCIHQTKADLWRPPGHDIVDLQFEKIADDPDTAGCICDDTNNLRPLFSDKHAVNRTNRMELFPRAAPLCPAFIGGLLSRNAFNHIVDCGTFRTGSTSKKADSVISRRSYRKQKIAFVASQVAFRHWFTEYSDPATKITKCSPNFPCESLPRFSQCFAERAMVLAVSSRKLGFINRLHCSFRDLQSAPHSRSPGNSVSPFAP